MIYTVVDRPMSGRATEIDTANGWAYNCVTGESWILGWAFMPNLVALAHIRNLPCQQCGSEQRTWKAWGSYLDKDLVCDECGHHIDSWDC